MGYIFSFILLAAGLISGDSNLIIAAGLFGIAGSIDIYGINSNKGKDE